MWVQRIVKEENVILSPPVRRRADGRLERLERRILGKSRSAPAPLLQTNGLPWNLRALQRFGVHDASLMTTRPRAGDGGVAPQLRFRPRRVKAMWVPGKGTILEHEPEFYFAEDTRKINARDAPWRLPAAGECVPRLAFGEEAARAPNTLGATDALPLRQVPCEHSQMSESVCSQGFGLTGFSLLQATNGSPMSGSRSVAGIDAKPAVLGHSAAASAESTAFSFRPARVAEVPPKAAHRHTSALLASAGRAAIQPRD